jgi:hypothetical protein
MKITDCILSLAAAAGGLHAATNGFVIPHFRDLAGSRSAGWDVLTVATNNGVGNHPDLVGNLTGATLLQTDPGAFATGSGNIYNLGGVSSFIITHAAGEPVGWVTFQARTLGAELDYASVRLSYDSGGDTLHVNPLGRVELDRGVQLGVNVSSRWDWDLNAIGPSSYRIEFAAAGTSLSFDSATLDTAAIGVVPEPSDWALLGLGGALLGWNLLRRNRSSQPT